MSWFWWVEHAYALNEQPTLMFVSFVGLVIV